MSLLTDFLVFAVSMFTTLVVLPRFANIAGRIGLLDLPDHRKVHSSPIPLVGGLGMIAGVTMSSLLFVPLANLRGFFAGIIVMTFAGFMDDYRELDHRVKFAAQIRLQSSWYISAILCCIHSATLSDREISISVSFPYL